MTLANWLWLALPLSFVHHAEAGITFSESTLTKAVAPADTVAVYEFQFKNTGQRAARIKEVRALCDCLKITWDRRTYQPGENGVLTAALQLGSYEGTIAKAFNVISDDPADERCLLRCVAEIPQIFNFSSLTARWTVGESLAPRIVTVKITGETPVRIIAAKTTSRNVIVTMEEVEPGRSYRIVITPAATDMKEFGMVILDTNSKIPKYSQRFLYFNILAGPQKP